MADYNAKAMAVGSGFDPNPSAGNIRDELITDAIESAGVARKGGTSPVPIPVCTANLVENSVNACTMYKPAIAVSRMMRS